MSCELAESRESGRRGRRAWTFAIPNLRDGKGVKYMYIKAANRFYLAFHLSLRVVSGQW